MAADDATRRRLAALEARCAALEADKATLEARLTTLDAEKAHYRWLAESTTDLISRHSRDGTFLYASRAARDLLGYEPEELIGVSAYDLFHPDDLADLLNKSPRVYYHAGFYRQTYRFRARDGHYVWFETTSRTRRDPATGELLDILCVSRDVSLRKAAEAQARRHQEQIAHANRLATTGELASNIAHELNQPLGAIANYASGALLRLDADPERPAADLRLPLTRLREQVDRLAERLRHIRAFVRRGRIRPRPVTLAEVVDAACRLCEWQFQQARVVLEHDLPEPLPRVIADPVALEQVLVNLLLNALEASRDHPGAERVTIRARRRGSREVSLAVADHGPGVPPADVERIFAPFHSGRPDGLGMGLAISHSLMEAMGGRLRLLPADGSGGATFAATLQAEAPSPCTPRPA